MKRILITGISGFVASHVFHHVLKNTDWDIVGIDGLSYAADTKRLTDNCSYDSSRINLHWWDLRSPIPDYLIERIGHVDYIINLASNSHVDESISDPVPFIQSNVSISLTMLEYARKVKPKIFIQFSTDEVFGPITDEHPNAFEEWERYIPSNPYSASKASQDMIAVSYWRTFNVPLIITHCMNIFGPNQNEEKLVPKSIKLLLQGKSVPVHGECIDGAWTAGTRFWLHARNCADALLFIINNHSPVRYPNSDRPDKFNISGDRQISNKQIVEMVASYLGVEPRINWVDAHTCRPGHDRAYGLCPNKLKDMGWTPPVPFEESFRTCVEWEMNRNKLN